MQTISFLQEMIQMSSLHGRLSKHVQIDLRSPIPIDGEFCFLKKRYQIVPGGIIVRPDERHVEKLKQQHEAGLVGRVPGRSKKFCTKP